ncbi:MAG: nucleotidyltransferase domain-containing protein [Nanoarchaeota archaeon]|nr:nucleotidyltransferase domain-containing protein [Nanoarchaeota archaeon]
MELIKNTIKVGNSAGVLLPKEFLNTQVKIVLQPLNIEKDILEILLQKKVLPRVLGVYLIGSYARKEQTIDSDIDVLVITDNLDDKISMGKYDLMLVSKKLVDEKMKENIFPLLPMMIEAKPIINQDLIKDYIGSQLTKRNLKWHIDTTKSAMRVVREYIKLAEETEEKVSDAASYSLILRLRTMYIINCLRKGKLWKKEEFLDLIKKISGSLIAYERYLNAKNNNVKKFKLPIEEAKKLMEYVNEKNEEVEKWLKEKKEQERKG